MDHGILGGYILFDRLKKNYYRAREEYFYSSIKQCVNSFKLEKDKFNYKGLEWREEHLDHFAIIADSIIAHNIWFSNRRKLYYKYQLEPLITSKINKIRLYENPLYFFLGLLDTIEPTKRFNNEPDKVLEAINITCVDNSVIIEILNDYLLKSSSYKGKSNYETWINGIIDLENWLDVIVTINKDQKAIIIKVK